MGNGKRAVPDSQTSVLVLAIARARRYGRSARERPLPVEIIRPLYDQRQRADALVETIANTASQRPNLRCRPPRRHHGHHSRHASLRSYTSYTSLRPLPWHLRAKPPEMPSAAQGVWTMCLSNMIRQRMLQNEREAVPSLTPHGFMRRQLAAMKHGKPKLWNDNQRTCKNLLAGHQANKF